MRALRLVEVLSGTLDWGQRARLDSGPRDLDHSGGQSPPPRLPGRSEPVLPVPVQELFGTRETPSLCAGRVPVMLHLLSPAGRPVQSHP